MPVNGQGFLHLPLFPYQQVPQVDALRVVVGADQALLQLVHLGVHLEEGVAEQLQLVALFLPGLLAHIAVVQLPDGGVQLGAGPVGDGVPEAQGQQGQQQGEQQHTPQVLEDGAVGQHVPDHPARRGGRGPAAELGPSPLPAHTLADPEEAPSSRASLSFTGAGSVTIENSSSSAEADISTISSPSSPVRRMS